MKNLKDLRCGTDQVGNLLSFIHDPCPHNLTLKDISFPNLQPNATPVLTSIIFLQLFRPMDGLRWGAFSHWKPDPTPNGLGRLERHFPPQCTYEVCRGELATPQDIGMQYTDNQTSGVVHPTCNLSTLEPRTRSSCTFMKICFISGGRRDHPIFFPNLMHCSIWGFETVRAYWFHDIGRTGMVKQIATLSEVVS